MVLDDPEDFSRRSSDSAGWIRLMVTFAFNLEGRMVAVKETGLECASNCEPGVAMEVEWSPAQSTLVCLLVESVSEGAEEHCQVLA